MTNAIISIFKKIWLRDFKKIYFARDYPRNANIHIGEYTYGSPEIYMVTNKYQVFIGKFCSIAPGVRILVDANHRVDWITTYPLGVLIKGIPKNSGTPVGKGDIKIGNDVWIGERVLILPGVHTGDGAVVGAGSVVTRNIDDYEIVGGNPARHIRYRFTPQQIQALKSIKWWDWPITKIKENAHLLQSPEIDDFIDRFLN